MKIFRALLITQLLTALLFSLSLVAGLTCYSHLQLTKQQHHTRNAIEQVLNHHFIGDGKIISRQIDRSFPLKSLKVSLINGTILHEQSNYTPPPWLAKQLLKHTGTELAVQTVQNPEHNIQVEYLLNIDQELLMFQYAVLGVFIFPLLLILLPYWISKLLLLRHARNISKALNSTIDDFIEHIPDTNDNWLSLPAAYPDIHTALNRLAQHSREQHKTILERANNIAENAYKDTVTGLSNRSRFIQYYQEGSKLEAEYFSGILLLTRCTGLQYLNQNFGYAEGDRYLSDVATIIKKTFNNVPQSILYRISSTDFALFLPDISSEQAEILANQLQQNLNEYQRLSPLNSVAYSGMVFYHPQKLLSELLAQADIAITQAQNSQLNAWQLHQDSATLDNSGSYSGHHNWRLLIDQVLNNRSLSLLVQPVQYSQHQSQATTLVYSEILSRFKNSENQLLPTASFLAMAEKLDRIIAVDQLIVETALVAIKEHTEPQQMFALNLSARSMQDSHFTDWLQQQLLNDPSVAARLVFEITEFGMQQNINTSRAFIDMIHSTGARVTVEKFGVGISSFRFFRDLKPDFIKMDASYTRGINEDKNNQYFIRLMIDLAHRTGVSVLAEHVEQEEELQMLESLLINGYQGYLPGKPEPLC